MFYSSAELLDHAAKISAFRVAVKLRICLLCAMAKPLRFPKSILLNMSEEMFDAIQAARGPEKAGVFLREMIDKGLSRAATATREEPTE